MLLRAEIAPEKNLNSVITTELKKKKLKKTFTQMIKDNWQPWITIVEICKYTPDTWHI